MKKFLLLLNRWLPCAAFMITLLVGLSSCEDEPDGPVKPAVSRTVLVYMVANNDLGQYGWEKADLREMTQAMTQGATENGGDLLVYRNSYGETYDRLVRLLPDGTEEVLKVYDDDDLCSVDSERLHRVLGDTRSFAPNDSYGIIFWSHGTGWIEESSARSGISTLSFGSDKSRRMKITSLARALESFHHDWIYFDCCHMGTVEIIYELRNAASQIVASTTELPLEGMPYHLNIPEFFRETPSMSTAAANTYQYYNETPGVSDQSCCIAVYETSAMEDFATATADLFAASAPLESIYRGIDYTRNSLSGTIFDMRDYIMALEAPASLKTEWDNAYSRVISYYAATPKCYGIDMSAFTGLGCYIVTDPLDIRKGYANYQWYNDVVTKNPNIFQ